MVTFPLVDVSFSFLNSPRLPPAPVGKVLLQRSALMFPSPSGPKDPVCVSGKEMDRREMQWEYVGASVDFT